MKEKVRDFELRSAFIKANKDFLKTGEFVNEYNINKATIDICMLNDDFYAFEIKSEADNLKRLPNQLLCYELIADFINLIVWENHLDEALKTIINKNVGIIKASKKDNIIIFETVREAQRNVPESDFYLFNLWSEDIKRLAKTKGIIKTLKECSSKYKLIDLLKNNCELTDLREILRKRFNNTYLTTCPNCGSSLTYNTSEVLDIDYDLGDWYKRIRKNFYIGCFDCGQKTFRTCADTFSPLNKKEKAEQKRLLTEKFKY